jgi:hypothetical protein
MNKLIRLSGELWTKTKDSDSTPGFRTSEEPVIHNKHKI